MADELLFLPQSSPAPASFTWSTSSFQQASKLPPRAAHVFIFFNTTPHQLPANHTSQHTRRYHSVTADSVVTVCPLLERYDKIQELTRNLQQLHIRILPTHLSHHQHIRQYRRANLLKAVHSCQTVAKSVSTKFSDGKRPSKLLTLQHFPEAQKQIYGCPLSEICSLLTQQGSAATNAANSLLLRLPPEIRCRIYDYAFGGYLIHLTTDDGRQKQVLHHTLCQSPETCASLQFQLCGSQILPRSELSSHRCTKFKDVSKT